MLSAPVFGNLKEILKKLKNIFLLQWIAQSSSNSYLDIFVQIVLEVSSNSLLNITEITKNASFLNFDGCIKISEALKILTF